MCPPSGIGPWISARTWLPLLLPFSLSSGRASLCSLHPEWSLMNSSLHTTLPGGGCVLSWSLICCISKVVAWTGKDNLIYWADAK